MKDKDLLYYNGYGGFSQDGKEYVITTSEKTTPLPWAHVIANENFGTLLTANGGGYIWYGNSQSNKLTSWSNDCLRDMPSEKLVLCVGKKHINLLPYDSLEKYTVIYGFGYAKYLYEDDAYKIETSVYVPQGQTQKVYDIKVRHNADQNSTSKELASIEYTMIPVMGVSREFTKKHIVIEKSEDDIIIKNRYRENYADENVVVKCSEKIEEFSDEDAILKMKTQMRKMNEEEITFQLSVGVRNV